MNPNVTIRMATEEDAQELLSIYSPYVTQTAISFEYDVPSINEFAERIRNTLKKYPYLVAVEDNCIIGYAYASAFKPRPAYDWSVELTVYLKQDCRAKGVGKKLYLAMENILEHQNILNANACIAYSANNDDYLDNVSAGFHQHLGYVKVAHFTKSGYKFGTWYDMIWMEKILRKHPDTPSPFIPITAVAVERLLKQSI
ncbi:GNAT family N-acetyltransferase [Scatolibacter rhodanostii]|uniref:GNAT family N-acetyltransferase n=1 Tax=Scatolibacter rhodanostii TaxID=2014781 RepID=UPI000C06F670|nr:GNAT family N-acetyltransferase [Scatolibacter rhodanostii]